MMEKIQQVFDFSFDDYLGMFNPSIVQEKAARAIAACKTGALGVNVSICGECGHTETHNNSCRDRNCPCCQALKRELWIDARKAEVIETPYFHAVFTIPAQLRPLVYANQKPLYSLLHRCSARTLLDLSADRKYLGATPGIIQVLHTWGQELNFHPHIHVIISGGGLSKAGQFVKSGPGFFIPSGVMAKVFRGKFLASLQELYDQGELSLTGSLEILRNSYGWNAFRDVLYNQDWIPFIKETFNGFGNAIEYLGRYTHRIAISNSRIQGITETETTFLALDHKTGQKKPVTMDNVEFIRRFLMHVLPAGFQKIRYYGFLNNRFKKKNLELLFKLIGRQCFRSLFSGMETDEILRVLWKINVNLCPQCNSDGLRFAGRAYHMRA